MKHYTKQELKNRFSNIAHDCAMWNQKRNVVVDELTMLMAISLCPDVEAFFVVDWLDDDKNTKAFEPIFLARERGVLIELIQERCEKRMEVPNEEQDIIKTAS
jgi:hypothetical protein